MVSFFFIFFLHAGIFPGLFFHPTLSDKVTEGAREIRLIIGDHGSSSGVENTCTFTVLPAC